MERSIVVHRNGCYFQGSQNSQLGLATFVVKSFLFSLLEWMYNNAGNSGLKDTRSNMPSSYSHRQRRFNKDCHCYCDWLTLSVKARGRSMSVTMQADCHGRHRLHHFEPVQSQAVGSYWGFACLARALVVQSVLHAHYQLVVREGGFTGRCTRARTITYWLLNEIIMTKYLLPGDLAHHWVASCN